MPRRSRLLTASLLVLLLLAVACGVNAAAPKAPPLPVAQVSGAGTWYVGALPPHFDPAKPVLLFVHGKGGAADGWWGETVYHGPNDMYTYAYNNGYRTAFVDLEPEGDMWANGYLLRQLISTITAHFGVPKLVVIAHSKGGVDANAAAAFFGAGPKIDRIITLGSPHWGTPLADLAYSTWTWWLAALLGQNTDATYVLQTGYMTWFRSVADTAGDPVPYYTLSGRQCGPFLTALWWGCLYLAGDDDGVVPLANSRKPGAVPGAEDRWDHDELRIGNRTWAAIAPLLQGRPSGRAAAVAPSGAGELGNLLARGGEVEGLAEGQPFPVESGVRKLSLSFYASSPDFKASLIDPSGEVHPVSMAAQSPAGEIFAGAWIGGLEIEKPATGEWRFETAAPERAGYLMLAGFDGGLKAKLELGGGPSLPGAKRSAQLTFSQATARVEVSGAVSVAGGTPYAYPAFSSAAGGAYRATIAMPKQQGMQNLTVTATGTLSDGTTFERTLVTSFAVVPDGVTGPWYKEAR